MATARPITLREYMDFMGDLIIFRKHPSLKDVTYLKLNPTYMDTSQLICKESMLIDRNGYRALAEPIAIFTATATPDDYSRAGVKLLHLLTQLAFKYPQHKSELFTLDTVINGNTYSTIYVEVAIEDNMYEDMQMVFQTFKQIQREAERLLIILTYHDFIAKGHLILNMSNPISSSNYVREVMSSNSSV